MVLTKYLNDLQEANPVKKQEEEVNPKDISEKVKNELNKN